MSVLPLADPASWSFALAGSPAWDCLAVLGRVTVGLGRRFPQLAAVTAHEVGVPRRVRNSWSPGTRRALASALAAAMSSPWAGVCTYFPALALAAEMGADAEVDAADAQAGQPRDPHGSCQERELNPGRPHFARRSLYQGCPLGIIYVGLPCNR